MRVYVGVSVLIVFLLLTLFTPFLNAYEKKKKWEKISPTNISTSFDAIEESLCLDPICFEGSSEEDYDYSVIILKQHKALTKFVMKKFSYKFNNPEIVQVVHSDLIKKTDLIFVEDKWRNPYMHIPIFLFAISKDGESVIRFKKLEGENSEYLFGIDKDEIKNFNNIIKQEEIKFEQPGVGLAIIELFLKVTKNSFDTTLWDVRGLLMEISAKCPHHNKKLESKLKSILHHPVYKRVKNGFAISFIKFAVKKKGAYIHNWNFHIKKNGNFEPISFTARRVDFSKNCCVVVAL